MSSSTLQDVDQAQQPSSDTVRITELEQPADLSQHRLKTVERDKLALPPETDFLHVAHSESLTENNEQLQGLKEENEQHTVQLAESEEGKVQRFQPHVKELEHSKPPLTKLHWGRYDDLDARVCLTSDAFSVLEYSPFKASPPFVSDVDTEFLLDAAATTSRLTSLSRHPATMPIARTASLQKSSSLSTSLGWNSSMSVYGIAECISCSDHFPIDELVQASCHHAYCKGRFSSKELFTLNILGMEFEHVSLWHCRVYKLQRPLPD